MFFTNTLGRVVDRSEDSADKIYRPTKEGYRQAGPLGAMFGAGAGLASEAVKEAVVTPLSLVGAGDRGRKIYDEQMYNPTLKNVQDHYDVDHNFAHGFVAGVGGMGESLAKAPGGVIDAVKGSPTPGGSRSFGY